MKEDSLSKTWVFPLLLTFIGSAFGVVAPDWDLGLLKIDNFIQHRSLLTHSFLFGWFFLWLSKREKTQLFEFFAVGVFIGLAVHLSFDLFPKRWWGGALIYVPFIGNLRSVPFDGDLLPPVFSFCWILGNIWICLAFIQRILQHQRAKFMGAVVILLVVFFITSNTERTFWLPLGVLLVCLGSSLKKVRWR